MRRVFAWPCLAVLFAPFFALLAPAGALAVPAVPANFVVENAFPGVTFTVPTKIAWLPDGRALVAEKRGRVWAVKNGVKAGSPMVAIDADVLDANDRGLLGLAVDPNYFLNHYIYLMYTVDPDSNNDESNTDAFSRLTRYTVNFTDSATVLPGSRAMLFGSTWTNGIVSCSPSHTIGDLNWGADGSLLVSAGDGASFNQTDAGGLQPGCFTAGRTNTYEDIGAFRCQSLTSLNGKILRLNPATGAGYASNPYYDGNLQSIRSRVWCYGLRNPFRFAVRPGTGVTDPVAGNPGVLLIGDVGFNTWEELNLTVTGGRNFGWPCYEGTGPMSAYQSATPAHNGCGSVGTSDNPTTPSTGMLTYNHSAAVSSVPVIAGLYGNTVIGGTFYTGTAYPGTYRQQFFFGDYGQSWVRVATLDASNNLTGVVNFGTAMDSPVCFSTDPVTGDVLYISITTGEVRRIRYTAIVGNANPVAVGTATPAFGAAPLAVAFSSAGTFDPDNDPITLSWSFGDGTGSTLANPAHTYTAAGTYAAILSVADNKGGIGRDTLVVTATGVSTFPSAAVLDNFNRPNGAIGGSWTVDRAGLVISGNALTQTATDNWCVWNAATFGANQEAYVTFNAVNLSAPEHDLMLKVQGLSWDTGEIEVRFDGGLHAVVVSTYTPGGGWVQRGANLPATFAAGDRFGARALADGTVEIYRNSGLLGTRSVAGWAYAGSGGHVGMTLAGISGSLLDNFGGGNVVFNNNTAPTAAITSPVNRTFYITGQTIALNCTAADAQDPVDSLQYHWDVHVHHNTHVHFIYSFDTKSANYAAENHDDGTGVFYRELLTVTDKGGLSARDSVDIFPEIDLVPTLASVAPAAPTVVDSLALTFQLRNFGRMPANRSRWRVVIGSTMVAEGDTIVAALDSVSIAVKVKPALAAGTYPLRVVADTLTQVTETVETNNAATRPLTLAPDPTNHPPVAAAAGAPASAPAPLAVNFTTTGSSDPDGDPLTFAWAFGDGGTGSGASIAHTYAAAGGYTATLTLSDGRGGSATANVAITVTAPVTTFPSTAVLDDFNRANGALGGAWLNATGISISSNLLAPGTGDYSPVWNGAAFGANQEAYITLTTLSSNAPEQDLLLKVQGNTWDTGHIEVRYDAAQKKILVSTYAPSQGWISRGTAISMTPVAGDRFGARTFADGTLEIWRNTTRLGTISLAGWPFAALGGKLGLSFSKANNARLDNFGGGTIAGPVGNNPPVAVIGASPASGPAPLAVAFTSAGSSDPDGDPLTFAWAFGDGVTATGATATHTYAAAGNYTATLTADDGRGGSSSAVLAISATGVPPTFPTTSVVDDFNRANGALGGSWVGTTTGLTITSNQLTPGTSDATTIWNGATFGVSQEAYVTLAAINTAGFEHDLMLKVQGLSWDTGHIEVRYEAPTSHVYISTYSAAQGWVARGTLNVAFAAGDKFGARARTDGTVEVYKNGTLVGTAPTAGWTYAANGGHIGLTLSGASGSKLDDFGGGNSTVASPALAQPASALALPALPATVQLSSGWPNPANGHVQFALDLPRAANVSFAVFDLEGRKVWNGGAGARSAGRASLSWEGLSVRGTPAPAGVYLARVSVDGLVLTRRLALLR